MRLQFSISSMMLALCLVSAVMAYIHHERAGIRSRRLAIERMGQKGPIHGYQPAWHQLVFGDAWPEYTSQLYAYVSARDDVKWLCGLTRLRQLHIEDDGVMLDEDLTRILEGTCLTDLYIRQSRPSITDAGLRCMSEMSQIESLKLQGTGVGDDGLRYLVGMKHLRELHLHGTCVSDAGLKHLVSLRSLKYVDLHNTRVTVGGIVWLRTALPNIEHVSVHFPIDTKTRPVDAAIQRIK